MLTKAKVIVYIKSYSLDFIYPLLFIIKAIILVIFLVLVSDFLTLPLKSFIIF